MNRFALRSVRTRLLIVMLALALEPLFLIGFVIERRSEHAMREHASRTLDAQAAALGDDVARALAEPQRDAAVAALSRDAAAGTPAEIAQLASAFARGDDAYELVVVADRDGAVIATSAGNAAPLGDDVRGEPWFEAASRAPDASFVGAPAIDDQVVRATGHREPTFTVAAPVLDDRGEVARVWSVRISWARTLEHVLATNRRTLVDAGAPSATVAIVDAQGALLGGDPAGAGRDVITGTSPIADAPAGWHAVVRESDDDAIVPALAARWLGRLLALGAALVVVLVAIFAARRITRPLIACTDAMERVAAGDLTAHVVVNGRDELARLAAATNVAVDRMRQALATIGNGVHALGRSSEDLGRIGTSTGATAGETSRQAGTAASASEQVGKNVQTVATGTEEMSATIREIAKNAADAAKVATGAVGTAQRTNELVARLGQSSMEIGNVVKLITSIAEQTNLLALNATIEAARAGDAGHGFAVVANEVKELAKATAKATDEISRKIETIQGDTRAAVAAIGEITSVIGQINDIQGTIASAVDEQAATTNEIGRNLHELAQASTEIARNVTTVASAASDTADCAAQTRRAASTLAELSATLENEVRRFHVGDPSATARDEWAAGTPPEGVRTQSAAFESAGASAAT